MLGSLTDLATRASAAKCITASILCREKMLSSSGRFARSTWRKVAPGGTAGRWPSTRLSMAITRMPRANRTSAQMLPTYPAAPVTRIFIDKFSKRRRGQNRWRSRPHYNDKMRAKYWTPNLQIRQRLNLGQTALEGKKNQIGAAADAELVEQVRNVELDRAFGNVELAGDFLVRKIFEERIEDFLFASAEIRDGISLQAAALAGEDRIHETGQKLARDPETSVGDQGQRPNQLLPGFDVSEQALHTETEKRKAVGIIVLLADDDQASLGMAFENIGQEGAGGGLGGVGIDDVDLGARGLEVTEIGRQRGFQLLNDNLVLSFGQNALELAQHQGVRREDANSQFGRSAFRSHYLPA